MPSKSPAQARLMAGAAHSPAFAKKVGVPQAVGKEFNAADAAAKVAVLRGRKKPPTGGGAGGPPGGMPPQGY